MKKEIQEIQKLLSKLSENKQTYELEFAQPPIPFEIGKSYLIRTVTLYYTGRVKTITGKFIQLEEAAWIPDTGRWEQASADGSFNEIEPFATNPWINTDSVIDMQEITYKLPTKQK
jgi:hypothetical protein